MSLRTFSTSTSCFLGLAILAGGGACSSGRDKFDSAPSVLEQTPAPDAGDCPLQCSIDGRSVIRSCSGEIVEDCPADKACGAALCQDPCTAAAADRSSNGCEFHFPPPMPWKYADACFATFVVNTSTQPVDVSLEHEGTSLDLSKAMFRTTPADAMLIPHVGAVPPGESVILFIADQDPSHPQANPNGVYIGCPSGVVPAYRWKQQSLRRTGIAPSFRLKATMPVSLAAIYPFGGAASHMPTASLLLPVVTWGEQHVVVTPWQNDPHGGNPYTQIVASEDDTEVTILPVREIQSGLDLEGGAANVPTTYSLGKGQYILFSQVEELGGSIVSSTKPTTIFGGNGCTEVPIGTGACDMLWQQIPSFEQWGSEYVAVGYRPRVGDEHEPMPYRIVAARDGTRLDYDPAIPVGAPTELSAGQVVTFPAGTGDAFVVRTQDADHPIYLGAYMTGFGGGYFGGSPTNSQGDPEFVNVIPAGQYLSSYSFYADPTYPETSLVLVRAKSHGSFKDVWLECAGNLTDWKPIGTRGQYEYTRVDLAKNNGPGQTFGDKTCKNGLQRMKSDGPFTATLWGWGFAASYAYPGGMAHRKLVTTPLLPIK